MRKAFLLFSVVSIFTLFFSPVYAGFGITPPYVRNASLVRNSVYEQKILLVRSDPVSDLKAQISIDVPGMNEWITILEGNEFLLPQGEQKVPMTVRVTVPDDAEFKNYVGNIRVKTGPANNAVGAGAVNISLGAQIDVEVSVIDKIIKDFRIRKIGVSDLNEGHKVGWLYFPGKIQFEMMLENTGNIDISPSRVVFRLYDSTGQILYEETEHTNRIKKVRPFATDTVFAELPTRLPSGNYLARYQIYNDDEVKQEGEINMSIVPYGTLQAAGYGFMGLSVPHKLSVLLPLFTVLITIAFIFVRISNRSPRRRARSS